MAAPVAFAVSPLERPPSPVAAALQSVVEQARAIELVAGPLRERALALRLAAQEALRLAGGDAREPAPRISPREHEVLELLSRGLSNPEVAAVLGVSLATVRTHVEHLLHRLDVSNRVEAVALGFRLGLLQP